MSALPQLAILLGCMCESKHEHEYGGREFFSDARISYMIFGLSDKVKSIQLAGILY